MFPLRIKATEFLPEPISTYIYHLSIRLLNLQNLMDHKLQLDSNPSEECTIMTLKPVSPLGIGRYVVTQQCVIYYSPGLNLNVNPLRLLGLS